MSNKTGRCKCSERSKIRSNNNRSPKRPKKAPWYAPLGVMADILTLGGTAAAGITPQPGDYSSSGRGKRSR